MESYDHVFCKVCEFLMDGNKYTINEIISKCNLHNTNAIYYALYNLVKESDVGYYKNTDQYYFISHKKKSS